jgi:hypothetical protein
MGYEKKRKRKAATIQGPSSEWEREWEAEQDARALARADACRSDPDRLSRAQAWAKKKLDESRQKKAEAEKMIELGEAAK